VNSESPYTLIRGDCLKEIKLIDRKEITTIVADPPYGMNWDTNSKRYSGGSDRKKGEEHGRGRDDWGAIRGDDTPFDPAPWIGFPKVILWGANHYAEKLPTGTTLIWIKKADHLFGTFLSDAEIGYMKGGHGVYCFRKQFPPPTRMIEGGGRVLHPTQKPVSLMRWCIRRLKLPADSLVVDPYMGSGTTGVAAALEGHRFLGIEIEAKYMEIARKRIEFAYTQKAGELKFDEEEL